MLCVTEAARKMAIQAITIADQRYESYSNNVDFIQKYIFPGGFLPSISVLTELATKRTGLVLRNLHDIGIDYALTLQHWRDRLSSNCRKYVILGMTNVSSVCGVITFVTAKVAF